MALRIILTIVLLLSGQAISQEHASDDTLRVAGEHVVFFTITEAEYDSLSKEEDSGIDEILSDFNYYADMVSKELVALDIKNTMTTALEIQIELERNEPQRIDRHELDHIVGVILTDGVERVEILAGVFTDAGLMQELEDFFNVK